jgi:hypothetical protein
VRAQAVVVGVAALAVSLAVAVFLFRFSLEKAALLAPVVVATAGATAFLGVLWAKIVRDSLQRSRRPWAVVAGLATFVALLVVLSFVVDLPRYGH